MNPFFTFFEPKKHLLVIALLYSLTSYAQITPDANGILYVKTGAAGNGSGWEDALPELATALKEARTNAGIKEIWVARGTYKPLYRADNMSGANPTDRHNAFVLVAEVKIYGGFDPDMGRNDLATRDPGTAVTVLSGDIDGNHNLDNNAYHVVISAGDVGDAELNGVTVRGGNANVFPAPAMNVNEELVPSYGGGGIYISESSPKITRVTVEGNAARQGAGISTHNSSSEISYVIVRNNTATTYYGGGIDIGNMPQSTTSVSVTNALIVNNTATDRGGGVYNSSYGPGQPVLTNVTIANNSAASGGGIYILDGALQIRNSIIWANTKGGSTTTYGADIHGVPVVKNCLTQVFDTGNTADYNLTGTDPLFSNAVAGDYTLAKGSVAVNAGNNALYPSALDAQTKDLGNNPRIRAFAYGGVIDLGAYESPHTPVKAGANRIVYVSSSAAGKEDGSSWEDATSDLHNAIHAGDVEKVFVAIGNYPVGDHSFIMKNGVEIYGGFDPAQGIEDLSHNRVMPDPASETQGSVLDGEKSRPVVWNVFPSENYLSNTAVLDGFTITRGSHPTGGGIRNIYASPTLINLVIIANTATVSGGGIYNDHSSPFITNTVISSNVVSNVSTFPVANVYGAGIYNTNFSAPVITNSTIAANHLMAFGTTGGAGIYSHNDAAPEIHNSIIWNNQKMGVPTASGADIEGGIATLKNSITQGYTTGGTDDHNKVNVNPLFVNANGADYTLHPQSPAINAGDNQLYWDAVNNGNPLMRIADVVRGELDLAGNSRLAGTAIDIGAYESPSGALPVRWISFEGRLSDRRQATLTWKTQEVNALRYEVERGSNAIDFRIAGIVTAGGTGPGSYSFTDPTPVTGAVYYRIRQVDLDGTFSYSRIISLNPAQTNELFAYPNPVRNRVTVELGREYKGNKVSLVSTAGIVLQQEEVKDDVLTLDMDRRTPGIYLLQLHDGKVLKLVKE